MQKLAISIDGACRRNGKPDCTSTSGVFVATYDDDTLVNTEVLSAYEVYSTNQRGEMKALIVALHKILEESCDAQIITDSEYLFNSITKDWCASWARKGWITTAGTDVKNRDLWETIMHEYKSCEDIGITVDMYHIKGHVISIGAVTGRKMLESDSTGMALYEGALKSYDAAKIPTDKLQHIVDLSVRNNGFALDEKTLKRFVVANTVADIIASNTFDE